ncbi:MAG: oxidoreductase [Gammaproteobacteria bacterium]|nr:oxidoreductase [Gammaproteobacteria bacterium]
MPGPTLTGAAYAGPFSRQTRGATLVKILQRMKWCVLLAAGMLAVGVAQCETPPAEDSAHVLAELDLQQLPTQGDAAAGVVIVEFADFQCPYCRSYAAATMAAINDKYVHTGKVRYVFVNFPLDGHPRAPELAVAGECARRQGKFWALHDELFLRLKPDDRHLVRHAAANIGLDSPTFERCLKDPGVRQGIQVGQRLGERLGVQGTPWFFIGRVEANRWTEVTHVFGARPLEEFEKILAPLLADSPRS